MIAVIQRVTHAAVIVGAVDIGRIERGVLALVAVEKNDTEREADRLAVHLLDYRLFADREGRMGLNVSGSRYFCESLFWASQPKQAAKT